MYPTLTSQLLYQSKTNLIQPTANRNSKTDFWGASQYVDALPRCGRLTECPWANCDPFCMMAQRFMSSMRPTIYASAASCRHIIAHPWKPMCTYLLAWWSHRLATRRGVSEPGALCSFVLPYLTEGNCSRPVPSGLFTWPACKNSFWGLCLPW